MNAQLDARLLAIGIDATTRTAGRARRKHQHGGALTVTLLLVALAAAYFGVRSLPTSPAPNTAAPSAVAGGDFIK
jgi:hypothetical protein